MFSYEGKRAIVTGAGRGIGRSIALLMARQGAQVALTSRTAGQLEELADEIRQDGGQASVHPCDLTDAQAAVAMVEDAAAQMGGLDVLVNNAGGGDMKYFGPLEEAVPEGFDSIYALNVRTPFFAAQRAARIMKESGTRGAILNIVSVDGLTPAPGEAVYGSAKAANISLTQTLAIELGTYGIRVNAIAPALIDTPLVADWINSPELRQERASYYPINRLGRPEDVAAAAVFLCSDEAGWISGVTLPVAGGQQATSDLFRWVRRQNPVPEGFTL
jgi:NAD(P)-dependent dehydrogenase (short-subunit alcohol dehydrogenase family)